MLVPTGPLPAVLTEVDVSFTSVQLDPSQCSQLFTPLAGPVDPVNIKPSVLLVPAEAACALEVFCSDTSVQEDPSQVSALLPLLGTGLPPYAIIEVCVPDPCK